ncbi:MAG: thioredoxin TrxC [Deltaproteobacteria bacterium]|nr:thioredoxin TrxC [Deltaproteobacteria bacterium]
MPDMLLILCPACDTANRVPADRPIEKSRCGNCHKPLFTGMPLELNAARLLRHMHESGIPLLVDFWAAWCGPCKMMAPVFAQAARKLEPRMRLAKVDTEAEQALAASFGISAIPTLMLFKNGNEIARQSGALDLQRLLSWISRQV